MQLTTMENTSPTANASDPVPLITPMAVVKPTTCSTRRIQLACCNDGRRCQSCIGAEHAVGAAPLCLDKRGSLKVCMPCMPDMKFGASHIFTSHCFGRIATDCVKNALESCYAKCEIRAHANKASEAIPEVIMPQTSQH